MLKRYKKFLKYYDKILAELSKTQQKYIVCKKGCSFCCENGDYPFSRLEMEYLMAGFQLLPQEIKNVIISNINNISDKKRYRCPFLIDNACVLYERRGITCRVHGLAYLYNGIVNLPECVNIGKNYSNVFIKSTKEVILPYPILESFRLDDIFKSKMFKRYDLEAGEIRSLIDWFNQEV